MVRPVATPNAIVFRFSFRRFRSSGRYSLLLPMSVLSIFTTIKKFKAAQRWPECFPSIPCCPCHQKRNQKNRSETYWCSITFRRTHWQCHDATFELWGGWEKKKNVWGGRRIFKSKGNSLKTKKYKLEKELQKNKIRSVISNKCFILKAHSFCALVENWSHKIRNRIEILKMLIYVLYFCLKTWLFSHPSLSTYQ